MSRLPAFWTVLTVIAIAAAGARAVGDSTGARVVKPRVHLGTVFQGQPLEHRFVVENVSSGELVLEEASSSCLVTVRLPTAPIPPGATGAVVVYYDTSRDTGRVELIANVRVRGGAIKPLALSADVVREFSISTHAIDLGRVRPGEQFATTITVASQNPDADVIGVSSTAPDVLVRLERAAGTAVVHVTGVAHSRVGLFGTILVRTSRPYLPVVRIPIRGAVESSPADGGTP